ncbi:MAG: hypothetical protein U1E29_04325 [Coriobacteriia bacterium]|nr:hypothetical protein [Coriobacteriia bacterium]
MVYTNKDKVGVVIVTGLHRIEGEIYVLSGSRLTDALNSKAKDFLAVTDARVFRIDTGALMYEPTYLAVNRETITFIFPS